MLQTQGETAVYKADRSQPRHGASFRIFRPLTFISTLVTHLRSSLRTVWLTMPEIPTFGTAWIRKTRSVLLLLLLDRLPPCPSTLPSSFRGACDELSRAKEQMRGFHLDTFYFAMLDEGRTRLGYRG